MEQLLERLTIQELDDQQENKETVIYKEFKQSIQFFNQQEQIQIGEQNIQQLLKEFNVKLPIEYKDEKCEFIKIIPYFKYDKKEKSVKIQSAVQYSFGQFNLTSKFEIVQNKKLANRQRIATTSWDWNYGCNCQSEAQQKQFQLIENILFAMIDKRQKKYI